MRARPLAASIAILCACVTGQPTDQPPTPSPPEAATQPPPAPLSQDDPADDPMREAPPIAEVELAKNTNELALDMFGQLRSAPGNLAFSPTSISVALAMTYAGARGETAREMASTMHLDGVAPQKLHGAFRSQLARWNDESRTHYELRVVNRMFGERSMGFRQDFVELTGASYGAPLEALDFERAHEQARDRINAWVLEQTQERIAELMPRGSVSPSTRLVLANAIYFKGKWEAEFDPDRTKERDFYPKGEPPKKVPMMSRSGSYRHGVFDKVHVLELPYRGDELSMVIIMTQARFGLPGLESEITAADIERWIAGLGRGRVKVSLPRFKIEMASSIDLKPTLTSLGMARAFTAAADFRGIASERLYVSGVFHKAFVEVNEEGTEAAAATGVGMKVVSAPMYRDFTADHPFLFLIRDKSSESILFLGRVADPT